LLLTCRKLLLLICRKLLLLTCRKLLLPKGRAQPAEIRRCDGYGLLRQCIDQ
jgi:hypothetical protein